MQVDGYSLEAQKNCLKRFAEREEMTVVDAYEDAGKSGKSIEGRPAFKRMLSDIENGKNVDYVLVYKLDRFSRNKYEMAIHRKILKENNIKLVSVKENIPDTPEGIILESVLEGMAEYYSAELSEKVIRGQTENAYKCKFNGGTIPTHAT